MVSPPKKSKTSEGKSAVNEYFQSSSINAVKIYVGPTRKLWTLPEDLLCSRVKYFQKAFKGKFKEAADKDMYLSEDDPASFGHLVDWIFGQKIDCQCEIEDGITTAVEAQEHGLRWCRLGVLAEKLCLDALSTSVAAQYDLCLGRVESGIPDAVIISYIFENTMDNSKLRELAVRRYSEAFFTARWNPQSWARGTSADATFNEQVTRKISLHMALKSTQCTIRRCKISHRQYLGRSYEGI
ncbi:hypothetical protein NHQ30_003587 [Ciborinia camelliae]|nr:hypothetical protein NHQ30_003587 [Ciborinia camelliae]